MIFAWGGNMRLTQLTRRLFQISALLGLLTLWQSTALAEPPLPLDLDDSRSAFSIGEELERSGKWLDAIHHYERAIKRWPDDDDLIYGRRRARVQFRVERRYADKSFRDSLQLLTRSKALDLFDQTSRRIRTSFVEPLSHLSIIAHGTESFYMALANSRFLELNLPTVRTDAERQSRRQKIQQLRRLLREQYWNHAVHNSQHARTVITEVAREAERTLQITPSTVVMEYVFGGCNALDDYSGFLTADRLADLYSNIDGEFVGLGVEMKEEAGQGMLLVNVLPDSPASRGGLRRGDRIVQIDGVDIRNQSIDEAASMMRGPAGSRVRVRVTRQSADRQWDATLVRQSVQVKSIPVAKIIDADRRIAYIHLAGFQKSTGSELNAALASLQSQGMKSLILDLRGNPGGLLTAAVDVLDRFIADGVLVSTRGRSSDQDWTYRAQNKATLETPLVLLTDGDSASASEIVAGAIRDHRRGQIVGRQTFGKWSAQSIFNLGRENGLRLTTAKFYSPNGHTLGKIGVKPDFTVERSEEHSVGFRGPALDEEDAEDADIERALQLLRRS